MRDVMEKAKYTALRRATEEEVRQNAIKNGIKIPAGMELKKVVEAVMKARADGGSGAFYLTLVPVRPTALARCTPFLEDFTFSPGVSLRPPHGFVDPRHASTPFNSD